MKLVTYNIYHGFHKEAVIENLIKFAEEGVELFCLQEVAKRSIAAEILEVLGDGWRAETFIRQNSFSLGLCIVWKIKLMELVKAEHVLLPKLPRFNWYERFIERHIMKFVLRPVQRGAIVATFRTAQGLLRVTDLHLDWHGHFRQRARQLWRLVEHLRSPVAYEVVCGDFNTVGFAVFSGYQERGIRDILGEEFIDAFPHRNRTTNVDEHLDYMFVKGMRVDAAEIVRIKGSDHFPINAIVTLVPHARA